MSPNGQPGELPTAHRAAIIKCDQVIDEYQRRQIGRASAVRALTSALSAEETGLDNTAVDDSLDSYLGQLDDADRVQKEAGQELQQRVTNTPIRHTYPAPEFPFSDCLLLTSSLLSSVVL